LSHLALYRKYRPLTFDDVVGQEHITAALKTQVASGRTSHAYLFTGTRGTGKTTCAKILARAVCCEHPSGGNPCNVCESCRSILDGAALDVSEIDAASNNSVDNIRLLRDEAGYTPTALSRRVYIIDEVHMLSQGAFNALLKTLEEPPEHVVFILATTEIHKVPATILSRCQRYDFRRIPPEVIGRRLQFIARNEGFDLDDDACALLARLGDGSMRDAISLLDRSLPESGRVTRAAVAEALGVAPAESVAAILDAVLRRDAATALQIFGECYLDGRDVTALFDELFSLLRDLYVLRATGREEALASTAADDPALLRGLAARATPAELDYFVACVSELLSRLTRTAIRRTDGEMCLMKMALRGSAAPAPAADPAAAAAPAPAPQPPVRTEGPLRAAAAPQPAPDGQPAPAEQSAPAAVPPPAPAAGSPEKLKNAVLSMVQSKVTPAVRTYLRMAEFSDERGALLIRVREEALGFMAKPALLDLLRETAQALSYTDVVVKGPAPAAPSDALTDLLKNARELGVETK